MERTYIITEENLCEIVQLIVEQLKDDPQKPEKQWVTKQECMEILGISSSTTLQSLRDNQALQFAYVGKRTIVYKLSSIYEYLEEKSVHKRA